MRIRWTPPAVKDMQGISDHLKDHHPRYRQPTMRNLYEKIRALKETPRIGKARTHRGYAGNSVFPYAVCCRLPGA
jgi:plasmid stabilization system protein ParE